MIDLNEIKQDLETIADRTGWWSDDQNAADARLFEQIPALVAELTQAREELAAVDKSLGDFYAPVLDPETEEPCGSFWKDHGVNVMRQELERAQAEIERLRTLVPMADLLYRLADYADNVEGDAALALAQRIEEATETALTPEAASRIWDRVQQLVDVADTIKAEATDDDQSR